MPPSGKTLGDVLRRGTAYLEEKSTHEPRLSCEYLASRLLRCKRLELYLKFDTILTEKQVAAMRRGVKRVGAGEPVQYVAGETEFMGRVFKTDKRALIPRPETETLVRAALDSEKLWQGDAPLIADVGTGSGCIAISLAFERPNGRYLAFDVDEQALMLAMENASSLGVLEIVTAGGRDLSDSAEPDSLDAVVANLPYVSTSDWKKLPAHIRDFEPRTALDGGPDGLSIITDVLSDVWIVLKPGGSVFLEIGADQAEAVTSLLKENGFAGIRIEQDIAGCDRAALGVKAD